MWRHGRPPVVARALAQHAAVSLAALVLVGTVAAVVCVRLVEGEALRQAESNGQAIATKLVAPLIDDDFNNGDPAAFRRLDERVGIRKSDETIQRIKVWSADGVILYCDDHEQMGLRYPLDSDDLSVLEYGGVESGSPPWPSRRTSGTAASARAWRCMRESGTPAAAPSWSRPTSPSACCTPTRPR